MLNEFRSTLNRMVQEFVSPFVKIKSAVLDFLDNNPDFSAQEKRLIKEKLEYLENQEVNILLIGGTGVGKSSTINALFQTDGFNQDFEGKAKVGYGPNPETQTIDCYRIGNLLVWDTPGLGESTTADVNHQRSIVAKLKEVDKDGRALIDLVLVILDGGTRDYATPFKLIQIISHHINPSRIIVGINKIDLIRSGRGWNEELNCPTPKLQELINEKVLSVKQRIKDTSKIDIDPIPYCAGSEDDFDYREPYEIPELLTCIISAVPDEKRIAVIKKAKAKVLHETNTKQRENIKKKTSESFGFLGTALRAGALLLTGGLVGGCFITTAVCRYKGKKDNCFILNQFRKYRDQWLRKQPGGLSLVEEYYRVAPGLVQWIDLQPNRDVIYEMIYTKYLRRCSRLIKKREYALCKKVYIQMVEHLKTLSSDK